MPRYDSFVIKTRIGANLVNMAENGLDMFSQLLDGKGLALTPKSAYTVLEGFQVDMTACFH